MAANPTSARQCPFCGDTVPTGAPRCPSCAELVPAGPPPTPGSSAPAGRPAGPLLARDPKDKLFCEIAIDLGFIAQAQAYHALEQQRVDEAIGQRKPVGAYLHSMNLLSRDQIAQILKMQDRVEKAGPSTARQAQPVSVQPTRPGMPAPARPGVGPPVSRVVYVLLGLFLGCLGVHNFVAGYVGRGIAQLLITLLLGWVYGLGIIVTAIWAIIEIISVTQDSQGRPFT